jgi:hypothetical protein
LHRLRYGPVLAFFGECFLGEFFRLTIKSRIVFVGLGVA